MNITLKIPKLSHKWDWKHELIFSMIQLRDNAFKFIDNMRIDKEMIDIIGDCIQRWCEVMLHLPNSDSDWFLIDRFSEYNQMKIKKHLEKEFEEIKKQTEEGTLFELL